MKTYNQFVEFLGEARGASSMKTGHAGHYRLAADLHQHIGKSTHDLEQHLAAHKKKYGYEKMTVDHSGHDTDKYPEHHRSLLMPGNTTHSKYTLHHKDGHQEHVYVDHTNGSKIHRIGHHSSTDKTRHHIHAHGKSMMFVSGKKERTGHHLPGGATQFEYHD